MGCDSGLYPPLVIYLKNKTQTMMKQIKVFTPLLWLALALSSLISCVSDDYNDWITRQPRAVVTVCPTPNGSYFMQLDDSTTLLPREILRSLR